MRAWTPACPSIAWVDLQSMGTWGQPEALSGYSGLVVVVFGRDADGSYLVDDRGRSPFRVSPAVMAAARGRIGSFKHRIIGLRTTPGPIPAERLRAAMRAGLEDQVDHLRSRSDSFSLPAWRKWGRLMTDDAEREGVAAGLRRRPRPVRVARSICVEHVDGDVGASGGHLRELYAASLDEAAVALDNPALGDAAQAWRGVADLWEDLADAAVPPDLDGAADAVEAVETLHEAVMAGEAGRSRVDRGRGDRVGDPGSLRGRLPAAARSGRRDPRGPRRAARRDPPRRGRRARGDRPGHRQAEGLRPAGCGAGATSAARHGR